MDDVSRKMAGTETIGKTTERSTPPLIKKDRFPFHIRHSAHTFLFIFGNHHLPSSDLQGPMTSREARQ